MKIPFCVPFIGKEEEQAVSEVIRSKWIGAGKKVKEFEEGIKNYVGCNIAVAVSSCTAALNICLALQELQPGDEVITTAYTFCSTIHAIIHQGGTPVFADIEPGTCNIDPAEIEKKITKKTRGIVPVHFAGQSCDMITIENIAARNDLFIIEDAAHAFGALHLTRRTGFSSNLTCFSFYPTKTITTGEGGCICCNADMKTEQKLRILSRSGVVKTNPPVYQNVISNGFKANMTDMQAAMGIEQLKKVKSILAKREGLTFLYNFHLKEISEISILKVHPYNRSSCHLYPVFLNDDLVIKRHDIMGKMLSDGVECSWHYPPVHSFYYFKNFGKDLPRTEDKAYREVSLPLYPTMTARDVRHVCNCLKESIAEAKNG